MSLSREADLKGALQAVGEQVLVLVAPALEALDGPPLSRQGQDALRGQIADLWRPSNPIRTLIGQRSHTCCTHSPPSLKGQNDRAQSASLVG